MDAIRDAVAGASAQTSLGEPPSIDRELLIAPAATIGPGMTLDDVKSASVAGALPEIEVFEDSNFQGDRWRTSFSYSYVGGDWNDKISSFIIYSGYFQFFEHKDYGSEHWGPVILGPGQYPWVADVGIPNDSISSWKAYRA